MFSVGVSKKVTFAMANLCYKDGLISFMKEQLLVIGERIKDNNGCDLFSVAEDNTLLSYEKKNLAGLFESWRDEQNDVWRLLSEKEWKYLLFQRKASMVSGMPNARFLKCTIRGVACIMLFPDSFIFPSDIERPSKFLINYKGSDFSRVSYDEYYQMEALENAGAVFLPAIRWDWEDFAWDSLNNMPYSHCKKLAGYYLLKSKESDKNKRMLVIAKDKIYVDKCRKDLDYYGFIRLAADIKNP